MFFNDKPYTIAIESVLEQEFESKTGETAKTAIGGQDCLQEDCNNGPTIIYNRNYVKFLEAKIENTKETLKGLIKKLP